MLSSFCCFYLYSCGGPSPMLRAPGGAPGDSPWYEPYVSTDLKENKNNMTSSRTLPTPYPPLQARYTTNDLWTTRRPQPSIDIHALSLLAKEPAKWPNVRGSTRPTCSKKCAILGFLLHEPNPPHLCLFQPKRPTSYPPSTSLDSPSSPF